MDDLNRIRELKAQGFYCSQIIMLMGMELQGKQDPDLVRAMQALAGGIGFTGHTCGALTGGACLLGLYAGKGRPDQEEDERLNLMLIDLIDWFTQTTGARYDGINCDNILEGSRANIPLRCPEIVQSVFPESKGVVGRLWL